MSEIRAVRAILDDYVGEIVEHSITLGRAVSEKAHDNAARRRDAAFDRLVASVEALILYSSVYFDQQLDDLGGF